MIKSYTLVKSERLADVEVIFGVLHFSHIGGGLKKL